MNTGKIVQVIGPVVDVQFAENAIPPIYQALTIAFTSAGKPTVLTLEIQQHLGGGIARAITELSTLRTARACRSGGRSRRVGRFSAISTPAPPGATGGRALVGQQPDLRQRLAELLRRGVEAAA